MSRKEEEGTWYIRHYLLHQCFDIWRVLGDSGMGKRLGKGKKGGTKSGTGSRKEGMEEGNATMLSNTSDVIHGNGQPHRIRRT